MAARLPTPVRRVAKVVLGPAVRRLRARRRAATAPAPAAPTAAPAPAPTNLDEIVVGNARVAGELASLRAQLAELQAELSTATSAAEAPRDLGYLFIVTYGRSGSTLLQGVLNAIPGYLIRGENRDALDLLRRYHHKLLAEKGQWARSEPLTPTAAWYGIDNYREDLAVERMRALVLDSLLRPRPDTRVVGFKEIRWVHENWERYLQFFDDLFPGARYVINTRDLDKVVQSSWWRGQDGAPGRLETIEERFDVLAAHLGDRAFRLHFDDWAGKPEGLRDFFAWLGEPFDAEALGEVMARRHST